MPQRAAHGTYEQERSHFMTTLYAQIDILKDNYPGNRQHVIHSLGLLLHRVRGLRMAGQALFKHDNPNWTSKCNMLYERVATFRDTLIQNPKSTRQVANDIESMMIFLDFCIPEDMQFRVLVDKFNRFSTREEPRGGDRSGAPSPEPRR
ncbi:uncharacterized protein N7515_004870 [Penicillium bovifimosum]|uniref:Uncharacterized protein n=1 Tax=Penicillium bovifimosum TaxID=126998 RepID=A0A9W9H0X9_9EURO|nr:uncharacterized protein N7515_004870 [Penicillium bovifimosum]KAJ5135592.1 hypothetical protein N7515_004870 [Penicillium bovifimosum]